MMLSQSIVILASGSIEIGGIWVFISGFDDDNDEEGMTYPTQDKYDFSILEGV